MYAFTNIFHKINENTVPPTAIGLTELHFQDSSEYIDWSAANLNWENASMTWEACCRKKKMFPNERDGVGRLYVCTYKYEDYT